MYLYKPYMYIVLRNETMKKTGSSSVADVLVNNYYYSFFPSCFVMNFASYTCSRCKVKKILHTIMCKMIVMIVTGSIKTIIRIECEGVDFAIKYEIIYTHLLLPNFSLSF